MSRPFVFVARRLPDAALARLRERADVEVWAEPSAPPEGLLRQKAKGCDGLVTLLTDRVDASLLDAAPKLKVVSNVAVGLDNIDVAACTQRRVAVGHTPGVLTETTADLAFALLLAGARRLGEAERYARSGAWKTWDPNALLGRDVFGATLGIAGFGAIGQAVARRAAGFSMRVLYLPPSRPVAFAGAAPAEKDTLLAESDFLSVHLPLTPKTRRWLDAAALSRMKPTAVLVNTARGAVVDTEALVGALERGRPGYAALDVTDPEPLPPEHALYRLPNALVVPHIGSATVATRTRMAELAVENLLLALDGKRPRHCANPELYERSES